MDVFKNIETHTSHPKILIGLLIFAAVSKFSPNVTLIRREISNFVMTCVHFVNFNYKRLNKTLWGDVLLIS